MADPVLVAAEAWRTNLLKRLDDQCKKVAANERYVSGDHPLPDPPKNMTEAVWAEARAAFRNLSRMGVTNLTPLIAHAPADRLTVVGFQLGEEDGGDDVAWRIWQSNHLDADSKLVHDTAFECGNVYGSVWKDAEGEPTIVGEHPSNVVIAYEPGSRWKRAAALKRWVGDDELTYVTLYLPDFVFKWRSKAKIGETSGQVVWIPREVDGEVWPLPNFIGVVPIVEFAANVGLRARPYGGGRSEFDSVLSIQDRINKTMFDKLVTAESQAFRQRYTIGWDIPTDPVTGQPDPRYVYRASKSVLGNFPEGVEVGEFAQADFSAFLSSVEDDVRWMAVITNTPPAYLPVEMKNLGADTLTQTNAGYIAKTKAHAVALGEFWEELMRLALRAKGDRRADDPMSQVLWDDIEVHTLGEKSDFALKAQSVGLPIDEVFARFPGATPQTVQRWLDKLETAPGENLATRSQAFATLVAAGVDMDIAARVAGLEEITASAV